MTHVLDLSDIQGNIVRAYGRFGFPHARHFFLHVSDAAKGRAFLRALVPHVTTADRWQGGPDDDSQQGQPRPEVTLNIGISHAGLVALDQPSATLADMPLPFREGMARRADILGDHGPSGIGNWDEIWQRNASDPAAAVHILVSVNAQMLDDGSPVPALDARTDWLRDLAGASGGGVRLLDGNGPDGADFQQAGARLAPRDGGGMRIDPREHFGFVDGIGDPVFEGQFEQRAMEHRVKGRGKLGTDDVWRPLATGEFLLGHVDESQELPQTPFPASFTKNGSFMAFRKLHEDVAAFDAFIDGQAARFAALRDMGVEEANATLRAKMVGRWANGVPLMAAPTYPDLVAFEREWSDIPALRAKAGQRTSAEEARLQAYKDILVDFKYRDDKIGLKCPIASHIRRGNVRDYLDPKIYTAQVGEYSGTAVSNRRRILRRGLPYGSYDPGNPEAQGEHGVLFLAICTNLERQFEFVLQQWINYGVDVNSGNDTCPLLGTRPETSKFVIQAERDSGFAPYIVADLPQFVSTRGGEYFFLPGLTALQDIANGMVDPI